MTPRFGLSNLKETIKQYVDQWAPRAGYLRTSGLSFRRMRERKVFCIGRNKTGTTSIKKALSDLGYRVGNQRQAERLIRHYRDRDFGPIIEYCHTAEAFQDVPFSWPHTYVILDQVFPKSKFILTIRDPDEWFASYLRHQKQVIGTEGTPTPQDLQEHPYVWKGWLYDAKIWQGRPEDKFYDEEFLKGRFQRFNQNVDDYFSFKDNLLVMDVSSSDAYQRLCSFLDEEPLYQSMPWENKTR
jgi:hypothetical protein